MPCSTGTSTHHNALQTAQRDWSHLLLSRQVPHTNHTVFCRLLRKNPITAPLLERSRARGVRLDGNALTRWLAAKQGDVGAAAEALHAHAQWRASFMPQGHVPEVGTPAAFNHMHNKLALHIAPQLGCTLLGG